MSKLITLENLTAYDTKYVKPLDDRLSLLEEASKNDLFSASTDSTSATRKQIPNKALSVFYIHNIGGCCSKSSNLIDAPTSEISETLAQYGIKVINLNTPLTIKSGTYTFSFDSKSSNSKYLVYIGLYDGSNLVKLKETISNTTSYRTTTSTYTFTSDYTFTKIYVQAGDSDTFYLKNFMLNKGSTALTYEPYYSGVAKNYATSVEMYKSNPTDLTHPLVYGTNTAQYILVKEAIASNQVIINGTSLSFNYNGNCYYRDANSVGIDFYVNGKLRSSISGNLISNDNDVINFGTTITLSLSSNGVGKIFDVTKVVTLLSNEIVNKIKTAVGGTDNLALGYIDFANKKFVKEYGVVDLGSLSWSYETSNLRFVSNDLKSYGDLKPKYSTNLTTTANIISIKYDNISTQEQLNGTDKSITLSMYGSLGVKDTTYTDATTFKTAMSGVMLYYELATPTYVDLSTILQDVEINDYGMVVRQAEALGSVVFNTNNNLPIPSSETYLIKSV